MNSALMVLMLSAAAMDLPDDPHIQAICEITQSAQTGSLLFSEGDCLAVRAYTQSRYTHVAILVMEEDGRPVIYDSMNGAGVRKLPLKDYISLQSPDEVQLYHPKRQFREEEVNCLRNHLEAQLGRPYSVKQHLTGNRARGLHCAEYVTDALVEVNWLKVENPPLVSPATLAKGILLYDVYDTGSKIEIEYPLEPIPEPEGYCARLWIETKACINRSGVKMSRWFLCR